VADSLSLPIAVVRQTRAPACALVAGFVLMQHKQAKATMLQPASVRERDGSVLRCCQFLVRRASCSTAL